jgi:flagella basal body P-ring formation protein FlgA
MFGTSISPSSSFLAVTKSDTTILSYTQDGITVKIKTKALYVGGAGDLSIVNDNGDTVVFSNVPAGSMLPVSTDKVLAATTATNIVALF